MWRVWLITWVAGSAVFTAVALRSRNPVWRKLAGGLWSLTGALVVWDVIIANATSWGTSAVNAQREAMVFLPLGMAMILGGIVLLFRTSSRSPTGSSVSGTRVTLIILGLVSAFIVATIVVAFVGLAIGGMGRSSL